VGIVVTQLQNYGDYNTHKLKKEWNFVNYYSAKIGYRYQKPSSRMTYKILFTPLWEKVYSGWEFHPSGAFSIGYNF